MPWAGSPGMNTPGTDYEAAPVASIAYAFATPIGTVYEFTLGSAMVQSWIDSPATNAGLLLDGGWSGSNSRPVGFGSSERGIGAGTGTAADRPTLVLDVVPEPASLALLSLAPLALLRQSPPRRDLALLSLVYSATQVCLTSFLVVYLTETLRWTLVAAGFALTAATLGGVAGRIGWGYVADRFLAPRRVLMLIGSLAAGCGVALALATPQWSSRGLVPVALLVGATAFGWNGVELSGVGRRAPPGGACLATPA